MFISFFFKIPKNPAFSNYRLRRLGFGCDTTAVVKILAHRDATQRALIEQEYRAMYSEELNKRLDSELSGDVKVPKRIGIAF